MPRLPILLPGVLLAAVACSIASPALAQPRAVEVTFTGAPGREDAGLELRGTLLLPPEQEDLRFPALLLLPGSGPTDRDGNQPPLLVTNLLKQIAERLAGEGIATLRFDKRAARPYAGEWPRDPEALDAFFAFERFRGDALGAFGALRDRPEIDPARVGILGHSEGGLIALAVASDLADGDEAPACLVLAATAGRTLDHVLREQIAALLPRQGADEATQKLYLGHLDAAIAAVLERRPLPADLPPGLAPLFNPTVLSILHSYFTLDPAALAGGVRGPVLVLQGDRDAQVSAERDAPRLAEALRARRGPADRTDLAVIAGASHNFKRVTGDADPGFAGPVHAEALERLAAWCRGVFPP